jgi:hypothetical protein
MMLVTFLLAVFFAAQGELFAGDRSGEPIALASREVLFFLLLEAR